MRSVLAILLSTIAFSAHADAVDDLVQAQMTRSRIPAAAVAIVEDGRITKLQGYGVAALEWAAPADADTPFQIASGTKIFTGVLLMRLVERGDIRLDDTLDRYFDDAPESWKRITVRHLANHTSGISDDIGPWPDKTADFVATAKKTPLAYPTGAKSSYGLVDFVLLRAVMEKASGLEFQALLDREIVQPLGLTHTRFNGMRNEGPMRVSAPIPGRAVVYSWKDGGQTIREFLYPEPTYAAGGLFSSARDIAKLFAALDQGRYLKPDSLTQLMTPGVLNDGSKGGFGVGWVARRLRGQPVAGHSGGPALADIVRLPQGKRTVIVLTNQARFYPLLADAVAGLDMPPAPATPVLKDDAPQITALLGTVLKETAAGTPDPSRYNEQGRKSALPYWQGFGMGFLEAVGDYQSADLIAERREGGRLIRTYLVRFAAHSARLRLETDAAGLIEGLFPVGED
ncbi:serine hydrolase domain-containing protein [Caulobacter sp. NIBR2454]|uniref:serine hydrolase domain-containing protein n=1 Tax=Caulobacter sp. NIBR2454 TaxID=3015996 RepID=UPI0022B639C1|nr:serine hydrolase domain-containing protein [Caulobacter sp. NIBR2454]